MTTISTSTALDRPITAWLTHQRALGRHYDNEERVLASLQRFVARLGGVDGGQDQIVLILERHAGLIAGGVWRLADRGSVR